MDSIIATRITRMLPILNERQKRIFLAAEAESLGHGGVKAIHKLTDVSMTTIIQGKKELTKGEGLDKGRVRKSGGGRKPVTEKYVDIRKEIEKIVGSETFGNPEAVLLWTTKSLRNIQEALQKSGIKVSHVTIGNLLKEVIGK